MTVYTVLIDNDTTFGPEGTAATGIYSRVIGVFDNEQLAREVAEDASLYYDFVSVQRTKLDTERSFDGRLGDPGEVVVEYEFEKELD